MVTTTKEKPNLGSDRVEFFDDLDDGGFADFCDNTFQEEEDNPDFEGIFVWKVADVELIKTIKSSKQLEEEYA